MYQVPKNFFLMLIGDAYPYCINFIRFEAFEADFATISKLPLRPPIDIVCTGEPCTLADSGCDLRARKAEYTSTHRSAEPRTHPSVAP